ncbi:MAG: redox-sensing transcriptional repressor Rex [Clostridiales bacterium]|nr:redox-sensing transcriptional repressor Rex [Clostridiales bacterium]
MSKKEIGVSSAVINRLPRYYRYLRELYRADILRISSSELSKMMNITASQIRHDFNCFGGFGQQGYGYNVKYLYNQISEILGVQDNFSAVIIGAGNLCRAISAGSIFTHRGVKLLSIFDNSQEKIGLTIAGVEVRPVDELKTFCKQNQVDIAVLTVPKSAAKETAEKILGTGIKGVWNYTNMELDLSVHGIAVQNIHLGDTLMTLCYTMKEQLEKGTV